MGAFILKDETADTITSGSLFARLKEKTEATSSMAKSTAAELREASKNSADMATISSPKLDVKLGNTERKKESETVSVITYIWVAFLVSTYNLCMDTIFRQILDLYSQKICLL